MAQAMDLEHIQEYEGTRAEQINEYRIDPKSRGLFVIIANSKFDGPDKDLLGYEKDLKTLKKVFNLKQGKGLGSNVKIGTNMKSEVTQENELTFDDFMDSEVYGYQDRPSFLLFIVMSHGNENYFRLSNSGSCCEGKEAHESAGRCRRRSYDKLVDEVCGKFVGIPKIFLMQFCRGGGIESARLPEDIVAATSTATEPEDLSVIVAETASQSSSSDEEPQERNIADERAAHRADCFILFACTKDQPSVVHKDKGSVLIQAIKKVTKVKLDHIRRWEKPLWRMLLDEDVDRKDLPVIEDLVHGWMTNILSDICCLGANTLWVVGSKPIKDQPEFTASPRCRLSFLRILETQKVIKRVTAKDSSRCCGSTRTYEVLEIPTGCLSCCVSCCCCRFMACLCRGFHCRNVHQAVVVDVRELEKL